MKSLASLSRGVAFSPPSGGIAFCNSPRSDLRVTGRRASGVEIWRAGRTETVAAAREVVLAAGAFQSPQLLICSGVGPGGHLRALGLEVVHDSPGVGENLQDHPDYIINRKIGSSELMGVSLGGALRLAREFWRYVRGRRGMLTSNFAAAVGCGEDPPRLPGPAP